MNFASTRKHLRQLAGLVVCFAVLTNCFSFTDNSSRASVTVEKKTEKLTSPSKPSKADESVQKQVSETFGKLPLRFEANTGQAAPKLKFLARGSGYGLFLSPEETLLVLRSRTNTDASGKTSRISPPTSAVSETLSMKLVKANQNPRMVGMDQLPGETNYFLGNDPQKWRTKIESYERVRYENVYRGIDLVYYGNEAIAGGR
jgi:hypothetical protein